MSRVFARRCVGHGACSHPWTTAVCPRRRRRHLQAALPTLAEPSDADGTIAFPPATKGVESIRLAPAQPQVSLRRRLLLLERCAGGRRIRRGPHNLWCDQVRHRRNPHLRLTLNLGLLTRCCLAPAAWPGEELPARFGPRRRCAPLLRYGPRPRAGSAARARPRPPGVSPDRDEPRPRDARLARVAQPSSRRAASSRCASVGAPGCILDMSLSLPPGGLLAQDFGLQTCGQLALRFGFAAAATRAALRPLAQRRQLSLRLGERCELPRLDGDRLRDERLARADLGLQPCDRLALRLDFAACSEFGLLCRLPQCYQLALRLGGAAGCVIKPSLGLAPSRLFAAGPRPPFVRPARAERQSRGAQSARAARRPVAGLPALVAPRRRPGQRCRAEPLPHAGRPARSEPRPRAERSPHAALRFLGVHPVHPLWPLPAVPPALAVLGRHHEPSARDRPRLGDERSARAGSPPPAVRSPRAAPRLRGVWRARSAPGPPAMRPLALRLGGTPDCRIAPSFGLPPFASSCEALTCSRAAASRKRASDTWRNASSRCSIVSRSAISSR